MSPTVFKKAASNLFRKPATQRYPQVKPDLKDNYRGEPIINCDQCIGCGICSKVCPSKAIEMVTVDGKKRPQLSLSKCIFCYQCAESCPKKAITNSKVFELATTDKSTLVVKPKLSTKKAESQKT
jgi:formate hydrogenlyase subunit 6/NADH:ubiquinone oxidoreductase subunit I